MHTKTHSHNASAPLAKTIAVPFVSLNRVNIMKHSLGLDLGFLCLKISSRVGVCYRLKLFTNIVINLGPSAVFRLSEDEP